MDINKLSLEEKIGQKFMLGVNSSNIDLVVKMIKKYYIGGVILYKNNYNNYMEMLDVIRRLKEANKDNKIPLFISIDQEGGRVNRLPREINNLKNIYDVSKTSKDLVYDYGNIIGKILSSLGVNMNFAPVLDMDDNESKVLYNRCFYGNIDDISNCGIKYIDGLKNNNVISVPKHFPGHGVSKFDSHFITPYIYNYKDVLDKHIVPFEKIINNGVDALMINHLVIRKLTDGLPASISYGFIKNYIRDKYNYDGLIITDELNMLSRNILYRLFYLKKALLSGSDILLIKIKDSFNLDKYINLIKNNDSYLKMIDDSVSRIIKIKNKYNVNDDCVNNNINIDEINREINRINELCV